MNRNQGRAVTPSGVSDHDNDLLELLQALDRNPINRWPDLIRGATTDFAASAWTRPTTEAAAVALESYVRARMAAPSPSAPERGVVARLIVDIRIPELIRRGNLRPCSPHVRRAMTCLQRATHPCTIAMLAGKCGCSVATLTRAFRLEIGVTIHRYELGVRLFRSESRPDIGSQCERGHDSRRLSRAQSVRAAVREIFRPSSARIPTDARDIRRQRRSQYSALTSWPRRADLAHHRAPRLKCCGALPRAHP